MSKHLVRDMIFNLFEKAREKLTDDELRDISCLAGEEAKGNVSNLKITVEGIASLIASDANRSPGAASGAFVDDDSIPWLLYSISNQLELILTMQELECGASGSLAIRTGKF